MCLGYASRFTQLGGQCGVRNHQHGQVAIPQSWDNMLVILPNRSNNTFLVHATSLINSHSTFWQFLYSFLWEGKANTLNILARFQMPMITSYFPGMYSHSSTSTFSPTALLLSPGCTQSDLPFEPDGKNKSTSSMYLFHLQHSYFQSLILPAT